MTMTNFTVLAAADQLGLRHENHNENNRTGQFHQLVEATASFTAWADDSAGYVPSMYICDATSGAITVTLPPVAHADAVASRPLTIKKIDVSVNAVTLDADGSETIDGATTLVLASQWDVVTVVSDGTYWYVISVI